jgi:hypothetical protein
MTLIDDKVRVPLRLESGIAAEKVLVVNLIVANKRNWLLNAANLRDHSAEFLSFR